MSELEALQRENQELRRRIERLEGDERRARERQRWVLRRGGSLFVPLVDRQRVVRNFVHLFRTASGYAGPRADWPKRDDAVAAAEAFALSLLRFFVRRRLFYLFVTLMALAVPALQVWLLLQQNVLIRKQNTLIQIQSDDIVARGITQPSIVANEINGALLSGRDVDDLSSMLARVFAAEVADIPDVSAEARRHYLQATASRSHLLLALAKAIEDPTSEAPLAPAALWALLNERRTGALPAVLRDAANRVSVLLQSPRAAFDEDPMVEAECQRYVVGLAYVLKRAFSLASAAGERPAFYRLVAPVLERLSRGGGDSPLRGVFQQMLQNFAIDLALEPRYGQPEPPDPDDPKAALATGLARLQEGVGGRARVDWARLRAMLELRGGP